MTPKICIEFGPNPPGVDPGQDHNRSMRGPLQMTSSLELEGYSNKPNV